MVNYIRRIISLIWIDVSRNEIDTIFRVSAHISSFVSEMPLVRNNHKYGITQCEKYEEYFKIFQILFYFTFNSQNSLEKNQNFIALDYSYKNYT